MKQIIEIDNSLECYNYLDDQYCDAFEAMTDPVSGQREWFKNVDEIIIINPLEDPDEFPNIVERTKKLLEFLIDMYDHNNIKYKIFNSNSIKEILEYLENEECLFLTNYFGPVSLQILPILKKKKYKTIVSDEVEDMDENKFLFIRKAVAEIDPKYIKSCYSDSNNSSNEKFPEISKLKLLQIVIPGTRIYYDYNERRKGTNKIFIVSDSKILTKQLIHQILVPYEQPYYQSIYEYTPKEFSRKYKGLMLTNLDKISIKNLHKINYKISKWIDPSTDQLVILQGDERSYSVFENSEYKLEVLPKFDECRNNITAILFYFLWKYECFYFYNIYELLLIKDNALANLLKYFNTFEEMEKAVRKLEDIFNIVEVEHWDVLLSSVGKEHSNGKSSITDKEKIYKFVHNVELNLWFISIPNKEFAIKKKYKHNLGIKYLLFIAKYCNGKRMKAEQIFDEVGKWHKKEISSIKKFACSIKTTERDPFAHRIASNFTELKKEIPDLKDLLERITLEDTCYYDPDITDKISIVIDDPEFPSLKVLP